MKHLLLIALSLLCIHPSYAQVENDTIFIKYDSTSNFQVNYIKKHPSDPHPEDHFPFNGMHGYSLKLNQNNNYVYWVFASYVPEGSSSPFYYLKVDSAYLNRKKWITEEKIQKMPYLDIIRLFHSFFYDSERERVIMLWDTTQPESKEVYLVRVYFDFDAFE